MKQINIGLFGFGVVGEGIYKVLTEKPQLGFRVNQIVIKQADKKRNAPSALFSTDAESILNNPEIDLVVELIDDTEAAYRIVTSAMKKGKSVVSANKKMIAEHHLTLIELSRKNQVSFLYEAAVCGSVPIIRNLEEYFDNDLLTAVSGIVNGSTNFILSNMLQAGEPYSKVLQEAQDSGFAESNPSLDVEGIDATYKLSIITLHAFGKQVPFNQILRKGITALHPFDFQYAKEKGCAIKLIASAKTSPNGNISTVSVFPTFVPENGTLGQTNNEFNGVLVGSSLADEQFFYGKGAGRYPTTSAVLSDVSAYKHNYKYEFKKGVDSIVIRHKNSSTFYVSLDKDTDFDTHIFDAIDETFYSKKRRYFIGKINHEKLQNSTLLNDPEVSIISYE